MSYLQFAVLGLGSGAIYVLLADGLIAIYRGSGVLNFAHGAYAMAGAFAYYELRVVHGWPLLAALFVAILFVACIGALTQLIVMRRLRFASPMTRLIGTLGVLGVLEGVATVLYSGTGAVYVVPSLLPINPIVWGQLVVPEQELWLVLISLVVSAVLYFGTRRSLFGLAVSAVAENERVASSFGWSPNVIATLTWTIGGALAGASGILIAPISGLTATNLSLVVVGAMAVALAAGFSSFPKALVVGLLIGISQSLVGSVFSNVPGLSEAIPLGVVLTVLVVRGSPLPLRSHIFERLPTIGNGRISKPWLVAAVALCVGLFFLPIGLVNALGVQLGVAVMLLSVVVLTGYAGQLFLAPYALAGLSALVAGRLVADAHWPFVPSAVLGVGGAIVVGLIFAGPALRTRGANLAIVTLGIGLAIYEVVFSSSTLVGYGLDTQVSGVSIFGWSVDPILHPTRYTLMCLVVFVAAACAVANLRRGRAGRRFIAIRDNERAATAMGINVTGAKIAAFAIASGLAGLGGVLIAFQSHDILYSSFDPVSSVEAVAYITLGGIGFVSGSLLGSGFVVGGIGTFVFSYFGSLAGWLTLIGGISVLVVVMANPNGIAGAMAGGGSDPLARFVISRLERAKAKRARKADLDPALVAAIAGKASNSNASTALAHGLQHRQREPVRARTLDVKGLTVFYGAVQAVDSLDLHVLKGEIVGLIGPNGAGKTTVVDAISGFTKMTTGSIELNGSSILEVPAWQRAKLGLIRSFQGVELFEDLTVMENLLVACDTNDPRAYLTDLVHPAAQTGLTDVAARTIADLGIVDILGNKPDELSYGKRRLVAIARSVAADPSVLLLDEPAAGLRREETVDLGDVIRHLSSARNMSVLLIEHDVEMVMSVCDRIVVMNFGRVIAEGTPQEVRSDPAVVEAYLGGETTGEPLAHHGATLN